MLTKVTRARSNIHVQVRSARSSFHQVIPNHLNKSVIKHGKSRKIPKRTSSVHSEISQFARLSQLSDVTKSSMLSSSINLADDENQQNPTPSVDPMRETSIISRMSDTNEEFTNSQSEIQIIDKDSENNDLVRQHHQTKKRNHKNRYWRPCLIYFTPCCIILSALIIAAVCLGVLLRPKTNGTDLTTVTTTTTTSATTTTATTSTTSSTSTSTTTSTSSTTSTTSTTSATSTTSTSVTTTTTTSATTTTTDIPCSPVCTSQKVCIQGVCVGYGYLSFAMTWSRRGDGDIVIKTANNKLIDYNNKGPSSGTDQGALDRDDLTGMGPENVVWLNSTGSSPPPSGVYFVCFEPYSISPTISPTDPITRTFTSVIRNSYDCGPGAPNLMGSYTYS